MATQVKTDLSNINYRLDGVDHIRIDPNAVTVLGRQLTIDYPRPFFHPRLGKFLSVASAMAYCKLKNPDDKVRMMKGLELRNYLKEEIDSGRNEYESLYLENELFNSILFYSISSKVGLLETFSENNLPFIAYYLTPDNEIRMRDKRMTHVLNDLHRTV